MASFRVLPWLETGAGALEPLSRAAQAPLDFSGVENLPELAAVALIEALGARSAEDLTAWIEEDTVPPVVQHQLIAAAEGQHQAVAQPEADANDGPQHALHPIAIVDNVLDEYRSYLLTEFRARDAGLREALEDALLQPRFLAQDAFFQAHRPFKTGRPWTELGLDARLAKALMDRSRSPTCYLHQSRAISNLLSAEARPTVVTTGTGSGKTECFLLPVIQNAVEDASRFKRRGITAVLVYPMNALANDQEERIREYLRASGHTYVAVERYDRSTPESKRQAMRRNPPHILLTNYMMLEYLLVRPADRDALFANHRCRFVVLDEVHTYRGSLGANIALLFRRLSAHLRRAAQSWCATDTSDTRRFPRLVPVATSATIKSIDEQGRSPEEVTRLRDEAVQGLLAQLTGVPPERFLVLGEELQDLQVPAEASWPKDPVTGEPPLPTDSEAVSKAAAQLAGLPANTPLERSASHAAILWHLNELLARRPRSVSGIVEAICAHVPERAGVEPEAVRQEVVTALTVGAAMPSNVPGALRLRAHRFIRGGWQFHRCVDPACGRLYAMGQGSCECGRAAAPLYLCRSCGADALRFSGEEDPAATTLNPYAGGTEGYEWLVYDEDRLRPDGDSEDFEQEDVTRKQLKQRPVLRGSLDPASLTFSHHANHYEQSVLLAPARNTCLVCGASAGAGSVLTPVALGTSAAVRVLAEGLVDALAEQNRDKPGHDGKERLLIFADSRQDAAHQARFINYAGRYDRMRRRLVQALEEAGGPMSYEEAVLALLRKAVASGDNPSLGRVKSADFLQKAVRAKAIAWEEAPLLDDIAASAGYRSTVLNLGIVGLRYNMLAEYVDAAGGGLAADLRISTAQLTHLCRCILNEMRQRKAFSHAQLRYHPANPNYPADLAAAAWERRLKTPNGYACDDKGRPLPWLEGTRVPEGIRLNNFWRKPKTGGRGPSIQRMFLMLLRRFEGVAEPSHELLVELLDLLKENQYVASVPLIGYWKSAELLQVALDSIVLELVPPSQRFRCNICNVRMPWAGEGMPCPKCHGRMVPWAERHVEANRYVRRIRRPDIVPLHAGEHTAQLTGQRRAELEESFKAPPAEAKENVLACSPTLEMGIDVGALDAVVMRNVPPRPDNYAQRGGRAGRRSRVGIVVGYARSRPHDGYFYDKPEEMIAGEVPAPLVSLGNRDVVLRHLNAIALGSAEPGLRGRMATYVSVQGELDESAIDELLQAFESQFPKAAALALEAWGPEILKPAGLDSEEALRTVLADQPARIRDLFARVQHQILVLQQTIDQWTKQGTGDYRAQQAMALIRRLLGIVDTKKSGADADDRTSGHPMRRFAEFGLLPGYEFPNEPATLRLGGDDNEAEPLSVERRFGLAQYQPEATVYARGHRWKVRGLDIGSPWNPKAEGPGWVYTVCERCELRYAMQEHAACPRCKLPQGHGGEHNAYEFGGFYGSREDMPALEEEDRFAMASAVKIFPQWNGRIVARYHLPTDWTLSVHHEEEVRWLNESRPPKETELKKGHPFLHDGARGFYLCPSCGLVLKAPDSEEQPTGKKSKGGRKKPKTKEASEGYGHAKQCPAWGQPPSPLSIAYRSLATTLRVRVTLPGDLEEEDYNAWGLSLGYALSIGMRQLYMLDGPEIDFTLESMWTDDTLGHGERRGCLTFLDTAVGGSGFLDRAATELHCVARRAIEHLDHEGCDNACYRCLKTYQNQRYHDLLNWPLIMPDLEALAATAPTKRDPELGDDKDPNPWLAAYAQGVGSPLELRFLRLFEEHSIEVDKQVEIAAEDGGKPFTVADFVVRGTQTAIYVDGAAFHTGANLRRDRAIRRRLQEQACGWRVVELTADSLRAPDAWLPELQVHKSKP